MHCLLLADGIGGLQNGDIASRMAIESCVHFLGQLPESAWADSLSAAASYANQKIHQFSLAAGQGSDMGTTLVLAVASRDNVRWVSIGDSLLYRYTEGRLLQLNQLHSRLYELHDLVERGDIALKHAVDDAEKESLTSSLGEATIPMIDSDSTQFLVGDRLLLASDGILTLEYDSLVSSMQQGDSAQSTADLLLKELEQLGAPFQDNCSLLVLEQLQAAQDREA